VGTRSATPAREALPSPAQGLRRTPRLWPLVIATWLAAEAVMLPAALVLDHAASGLPDSSSMRGGDAALALSELVRATGSLVLLLALAGAVAGWAWSILWRAGVVRHRVWASGRPEPLAELVGLGIGGWPRFAIVSLTGLVALVLVLALLWTPLVLWLPPIDIGLLDLIGPPGAASPIDQTPPMLPNRGPWSECSALTSVQLITVGIAALLSLLVMMLVRAATEWGLWLQAVPLERPLMAWRAWLSGLRQCLRHPLRGPGTVGLAVLAGAAVGGLPLLAGALLPALRGGPAALVLGQVAGLAQAYVQVALFMSFAPVADGLLDDRAGSTADTPGHQRHEPRQP